jgi:predicted phosphoadenosine phosphosulfate sulfurtransferase
LTSAPTYKDITWGRIITRHPPGHYVFYPIYDWGYQDVWKAIHDHRWPYCVLYDYQYRYGIPVREMRVSNVHHETAIHSLKYLQEIEPRMWDRVTARLSGVHAVGAAREVYELPEKLPFMFADWTEYRDYLLEHLITDRAVREIFRRQFQEDDREFVPEIRERLRKCQISALLVNDYEGTKLKNFRSAYAQYRRGYGRGKDRYSWQGSTTDQEVISDAQ